MSKTLQEASEDAVRIITEEINKGIAKANKEIKKFGAYCYKCRELIIERKN